MWLILLEDLPSVLEVVGCDIAAIGVENVVVVGVKDVSGVREVIVIA